MSPTSAGFQGLTVSNRDDVFGARLVMVFFAWSLDCVRPVSDCAKSDCVECERLRSTLAPIQGGCWCLYSQLC